jgi:hypothetical protein
MASMAIQAQVVGKFGAWQVTRTVGPGGAASCSVVYATNPKITVVPDENFIAVPVTGPVVTVITRVGVIAVPRAASDQGKKASAVFVAGDDLKRLLAGNALQFEVLKGPPMLAAAQGIQAVQLNGAGLSEAMKNMRVACQPATVDWNATQSTDPNDPSNNGSIDPSICGGKLLARMRAAGFNDQAIIQLCHP